MSTHDSRIDQDLKEVLDTLKDQDEIDVLLYPKVMGKSIKEMLQSKKDEGLLDYNVLAIANCIVVKAPKKIILQIATRDDVSRIAVNPRFTAGS